MFEKRIGGMRMKKIFVLLLAVLLCVGLAAGASAASGVSGECSWNLDENTGLLMISGNGAIPANRFRGNPDIKSAVIEEGITSIGNNAFYGCSSLEKVVIKGDLSIIGNYAFAGCASLTTLEYWGKNKPTAALNAFSKTSLSEVMVLPEYPDGYFCGIPASPTLDDEPIKPTYSVTVEDGTADKTAYTAGDTVTITANTPAVGMRFAGWTSSDGVTFENSSAATTTFTMPAKAVTVTATFSQIHVCADHLTPIEANAATCIKAGNTAYYTCICGKYYQDDEAQTEIEKDSWVISDPNAHDWAEPTYTQQGEKHVAHYVCKLSGNHTKQDDPANHVYSAPDYICVCEKVQQFTITFETGEGSAVEPITQEYGSAVTAPENPTKDGYIFAGWADEAGNIVSFPMNMPQGGMELTAVWEKVPDLPKTGDNSHLALWFMLMGMAGAAMLMIRKRVHG